MAELNYNLLSGNHPKCTTFYPCLKGFTCIDAVFLSTIKKKGRMLYIFTMNVVSMHLHLKKKLASKITTCMKNKI